MESNINTSRPVINAIDVPDVYHVDINAGGNIDVNAIYNQ